MSPSSLSPRWFVAQITGDQKIAKSLKLVEKPKWFSVVRLLKDYRPMKLMTEFPGKNWKRNGLDNLLMKLCETRSTDG